jgi:hypothetical protein
MRRYPDLYRNTVHLFEIEETHRELVIDVSSIVETLATPVSAIPTDVPLAAVRAEEVIESFQPYRSQTAPSGSPRKSGGPPSTSRRIAATSSRSSSG